MTSKANASGSRSQIPASASSSRDNPTSSSSNSHVRKLRYRALLEDLASLDEEDDTLLQVQRTASAVKEARTLLAEGDVQERVRHPGEGFLDSRVLKATSDLAISCSASVSGNVNTYDKHELARHMKENPEFWSFSFPREVPTFAYLHGTFAAAPPEERPRAPRRRVERQQLGALQAPEDVEKLEKTEEGSEMVSRVNRFIIKSYKNGGEKPLSYFHVVLDPDSFARTVENIYYMSFLVRDNLISIFINEEKGLPFVRPVTATERATDRFAEAEENQFIVSMDMKRWQELTNAFRIKQPMMVLKRS